MALLGTLVVLSLSLLIAGAFSFLLHEAENPGASLDKFMALVEQARSQLPPFIEAYLPASAAEFKVAIGDWIKSHLSDLQLVGKGMAHMFVTLLIGMILGAIIALQRIPDVSGASRWRRHCSSAWPCWYRRFATSSSPRSRFRCSTRPLPAFSWQW